MGLYSATDHYRFRIGLCTDTAGAAARQTDPSRIYSIVFRDRRMATSAYSIRQKTLYLDASVLVPRYAMVTCTYGKFRVDLDATGAFPTTGNTSEIRNDG